MLEKIIHQIKKSDLDPFEINESATRVLGTVYRYRIFFPSRIQD